ncbi:MAG: DUF2846 domain-containing protein [Pseudomonadales bacterium]|nr:DUF2846 domain-containing protein [Pseudomonadales bacterium]
MRGHKELVVLATLAISACSDMTWVNIKSNLDQKLSSSILHTTTAGDAISPVKGTLFEPVQPLDSRDAIVYIYRPMTRWSQDEAETPSFFVNGQRVYGLKGGGYFWLELPAGDYYLMAKRAFSIFNFKVIFETHMRVAGAKAYYFRYDEERKVDKDHQDSNLLISGPLQQQTAAQALPDLRKTVLEDSGQFFDYDREPLWKPFDLYPHDHNVRYGQLEILDPDHGVHERYTPVLGADTSQMQNAVDRKTDWMPDWMRNLFR